jgi:hypothetical protein
MQSTKEGIRMSEVRQTSMLAFTGIIEDGTAKSQYKRVLDLLLLYPEGLTRDEISELTNIMYSSVCGRVNALLKAEKVYENDHYTKLNKSGKKAYIVRLMR